MQIGETGLFDFFSEVIQRLPRFRRVSAEALHQFVDTEYREHRTTVYLEVVRLFEIPFDHSLHDRLIIRLVDNGIPQEGCIIRKFVHVPVVLFHIVVGPHNIKLHVGIVFRLQESVVQRAFEERPSVIPVPVEDKDVDAVANGRFDPFLHDSRIIVHLTAPQRASGLVVPVEPRIAFVDDFPFALSFGPKHVTEALVMMARRPDICRYVIAVVCSLLCLATGGVIRI